MKVKITFQPKERLTVFAIVRGGFLPLFCCNSDLLLIDRNMVSNALNILDNGRHLDKEANKWWYEFVNTPNYLLNPVLAALEGPNQSIPTFDEFREEFLRCSNILRKALPKARVIDFDERAYQGSYDLLKEITTNYEAEVDFLIKAAPTIAVPIASNKLQHTEAVLFDLAKESKLNRLTLSLIACLSCLYDNGSSISKKSPGRAVLKPKLNYTREMAHNAIMDLYALALLIQGSAKLDRNIAICTSDKGLVKFWCALKIHEGWTSTESGFSFNFEFSEEMFPRLIGFDINDLKSRIESYVF